MQGVFAIARRDFIGYLKSPKAGAIFWFLFLITGIFFNVIVQQFSYYATQSRMSMQEAPHVNQLITILAQQFQFFLLFIIPAITMGCFAEDRKNQTFKLLQTSPLSSFEIVLGKYFSVLGVMVLVLLFSSVHYAFILAHGNPDPIIILTCFLGLFLCLAMKLAFGLWISSFFSNVFLAFIVSTFGIFVLLILNNLAQGATGSEAWYTELAKNLAIQTHFENFTKGVISTTDILYFVCFTALFLFLTNATLDSERWR